MTRKVILTGLMVFWAPGTIQQLLLGSTISAVYMAVAIWKQPYAIAFNNRFKIITDASVVLTFNIAVLLNPGVTESDDEASKDSNLFFVGKAYLWVALFVINLGTPAALLVYELWQYYANRETASRETDSSQSETQQQVDGVPTGGGATMPTEQSSISSPPKDKGKRGVDSMNTFENPLSLDDGSSGGDGK